MTRVPDGFLRDLALLGDGVNRQAKPVVVPPWDDNDPYTTDGLLCDDDGIVRSGPMHHGTDYPCTGHAHHDGHHIRCTSAGHPGGLPADLRALLSGADLHVPAAQNQQPDGGAS